VAPSVQRRKVWLTPTTKVPCSNAAKTRNPLKFAEVPQTRQQISAVSRSKFTILSGHVEEVLQFNKFFPIVDAAIKISPGQSWTTHHCQNDRLVAPHRIYRKGA